MTTYYSHLQVYVNMLQYTGLECDMSVRFGSNSFCLPLYDV